MRRCFLLINLLVLLSVLPCRAQETVGDSVVGSEYTFFMQARGQEITGICMVSQSPDGQTTGTIVNEFGVKAFDFIISKGKLKKDFGFTFQHIREGKDISVGKRSISFRENGDIAIDNDRYNIHYVFTPITASNETDQ